jgi:hypothetical protein
MTKINILWQAHTFHRTALFQNLHHIQEVGDDIVQPISITMTYCPTMHISSHSMIPIQSTKYSQNLLHLA